MIEANCRHPVQLQLGKRLPAIGFVDISGLTIAMTVDRWHTLLPAKIVHGEGGAASLT